MLQFDHPAHLLSHHPSASKSSTVVLENGLQIVAVNFPKVRSIFLRVWVRTGSAYEPLHLNGISHFLEHMMFRGNATLGDSYRLNLAFEELGGEINASTSVDFTEYWLLYHQKFLELGIQRFCRFLQTPLFEQLDAERSILTEEIKSDYNEENRLVDLGSIAAQTLWSNKNLGNPVVGTIETIKDIKEPDLRSWFDNHYFPGNMVVGICGDFDVDQVVMLLENEFKSMPPKARHPVPDTAFSVLPGNQLIFVPDRDNQFYLQWSFPVENLTPSLRIKLDLIQRLLDDGSSCKLQRWIRDEKGLVYDISCEVEYVFEIAVLSISAVVSEEKFLTLVEVLFELVEEIGKKGFTDAELTLAKSRYQMALDFQKDTAYGLLWEIIAPKISIAMESIEDTAQAVESSQLNEINTYLPDIFLQKSSSLVVVGPIKETHKKKIAQQFRSWML